MKSHAALTSVSAPPRRGMSTRPGRVRLLPIALLLLAVPLAVAAWGLGGYSAQRERNNADTRLIDSLNSAGGVYRDVLSNVDSTATRLSGDRRVQHELFHGGHRAAVVWRMGVNGQVKRWRDPIPAAAAVRRIDFLSTKGRTIGQVAVFLPLDPQLVRWLARRADLGSHRQLGFTRGGRLVGAKRTLRIQSGKLTGRAGDIRAGGTGYRTVSELGLQMMPVGKPGHRRRHVPGKDDPTSAVLYHRKSHGYSPMQAAFLRVPFAAGA